MAIPGYSDGQTAAAATRPILRESVNGVPGSCFRAVITAPKVGNAAPLLNASDHLHSNSSGAGQDHA